MVCKGKQVLNSGSTQVLVKGQTLLWSPLKPDKNCPLTFAWKGRNSLTSIIAHGVTGRREREVNFYHCTFKNTSHSLKKLGNSASETVSLPHIHRLSMTWVQQCQNTVMSFVELSFYGAFTVKWHFTLQNLSALSFSMRRLTSEGVIL